MPARCDADVEVTLVSWNWKWNLISGTHLAL